MPISVLNIKDNKLVKEVVALGTKNSKTLGHFPEGAFIEYIKKRFLIIEQNEKGELLGYVLFSITQSKRIIRVIHLCIDEKHRGKKVATNLLNELKQKYSNHLRGISLSCREDYVVATKFWKNYGFKAKLRKRSRSKKENYLIKWWYDFGIDDLFSNVIKDSGSVKAVLDANIIIKMRDEDEDETGVKYLIADWLDDINYYYAPEIFNEINRDKNKERAELTRKFIRNYSEINFKPDKRDKVFNEISSIISGNSINDNSDKLQLSECIASEVGFFITTDKNILNSSDLIFERYGVQTLRPTDFILLIHQSNNKSNYYSSRLAGVRYDYKRIQSFQIDDLITSFLTKSKGEKKYNLRNKITSLASDIISSKIMLVTDKNKNNIGIWGAKLNTDTIDVLFIRTIKSKLSSVLFNQLVSRLINLCIKENKSYLIIRDEFINKNLNDILISFGFLNKNNKWIKVVDNGIVNSIQYFSNKNVSEKYFDNKQILNHINSKNELYKLQIEKTLFPLKFDDLDIPTYIIPIKPYWASQLFDFYIASESLFGATPELSWNRENVYYRSVRPISEKSPARILWYVSKGKNEYSNRRSCIVGCSYLDGTNVGKPKDLFQKYKAFGIYKWKDIYTLAKEDIDNSIKAIEFSDTEIFKKPIYLSKVNEILVNNERKKNTFASPLKVNNKIFNDIYILGINN